MKATLNVKVVLDGRNVVTKIGAAEGMEDMEITLLQTVLKIMADTQKKIKQQVDRFYGEGEGVIENSEVADEQLNDETHDDAPQE